MWMMREGSVRLEEVAHRGPRFDPDWATGSLYALGPIVGVAVCVAHGIAYGGSAAFAVGLTLGIVALIPLARAVELVRLARLRGEAVAQLERMATAAPAGTEQVTPRIVCRGHAVELSRMARSLASAEPPAPCRITPLRPLLLGIVFLACINAGASVDLLGWTPALAALLIVTIAACALLANWLLRVTVDFGDKEVTIRPAGMLSRACSSVRTIRLDAPGTLIVCDFARASIAIRAPDGHTIGLGLWSTAYRHALAAEMIRAAN